MKEPRSEPKKEDSYHPSHSLVKYLNETLLLFNVREKLKVRGKELPDEKEKRIEQKYKDKITVLNRHMFQSMASLVYFFEFCNTHPKFSKQFEEDIEELLLGWNKSDEEKVPVFYRFIRAIVYWNFKKDPSNFRLLPLFLMQELIATKVIGFASLDFNEEVIESIIRPDFNRASAWLKLYARKALILPDDEENKVDYDRPVLF